MPLTITQVDAFTNQPFSGNPAAVCVLPEPRDGGWMQAVAQEMNLSETAFLIRGEESFHLRWFTPAIEVDLCGHATLAGAHVLWEEGHLATDAMARFDTRSGRLTAERHGDWIAMDFPAEPASAVEAPSDLITALDVDPLFTGRNRFDYLVQVDDEDRLRALQPDFHRLQQVSMRGVIVTSRSVDRDDDFVSRYFAPAAGINEDPVTGSAHCCLGPFWGARLEKTELVGYQASARGGVVRVGLQEERVTLSGQAVTVMRGELVGT